MARSCWYQGVEMRDMFARKGQRRNLSPSSFQKQKMDSPAASVSQMHRARSKSSSERVDATDSYFNGGGTLNDKRGSISSIKHRNVYNLAIFDVDNSSDPFSERSNDIHNNNLDSTHRVSGSTRNLLAGRELIIGERIRSRTRTLSGSGDVGDRSGSKSRSQHHSSTESRYDVRIAELINVVLLTCVFVLGVLSAVFVIVCYKHGDFGMGPVRGGRGRTELFQPFPEAEQLAVIDEHYLDPVIPSLDEYLEDNECDGENKLGMSLTMLLVNSYY